jgi:hypothetical protein
VKALRGKPHEAARFVGSSCSYLAFRNVTSGRSRVYDVIVLGTGEYLAREVDWGIAKKIINEHNAEKRST